MQETADLSTQISESSRLFTTNYDDEIVYNLQRLDVAKEIENKAWEGCEYCKLGNTLYSLGEFKKALQYHEQDLSIAIELNDKAAEGRAYGNLGITFHALGDFKKAIDYHNQHLSIAKELRDKDMEGSAYCNLGCALLRVGDIRKAIHYHNLQLKIAKGLGDKDWEGTAYCNLGNAFYELGDYKKAVEYHKHHLSIATEMINKAGEAAAYCNLGNAFQRLGDLKRAVHYHTMSLKIATEVQDKGGEEKAYCCLGTDFQILGDFKKAIDYHNIYLSFSKEVGDKAGEGRAYYNLGMAFQALGDIKKAKEYHTLHLTIAKEVGDKIREGHAYGHLGNAFYLRGDFKKAIDFQNRNLNISKNIGDRNGERFAYGNLGNIMFDLGDFKKAIEYHNLNLILAKELGDKIGEGRAYCNLGSAYANLGHFERSIEYNILSLGIAKDVGLKKGVANGNLGLNFLCLGDFETAINHFNVDLNIAKEQGDKAGEGRACCNLGCAFQGLGDFKTAIDYHNVYLTIAKEANDTIGESRACHGIGRSLELLGSLPEALDYYRSSVKLLNNVRGCLQLEDRLKISFRDQYNAFYAALWKILLKQNKVVEALIAAEEGRAQGLVDLIEINYGVQTSQSGSSENEENGFDMLSYISSSTLFQAVEFGKIYIWILSKKGPVRFRQKDVNDFFALLEAKASWELLIRSVYNNIGVRTGVRCEDRSMDKLREDIFTDQMNAVESLQPALQKDGCLSVLYNMAIKPIADMVQGNELIIVPDGPLWLAPYSAFVDSDSKYLCESFRIRLIPSLTSLKLIADCPEEYHSRSGALLVGDPWVAEVTNSEGEKPLEQLKFAKQEVEMIGKIIKIVPLTGKGATKIEVLKQMRSVALVHIAAHGCMETGEIALTPDPERSSLIPTKDDYVLTMADVLSVQLRARLVVLSCCHSGRGEIKAEGVVGIARAFMGAGARSVLVSLWAIDDEATLEFMRSFYHHLMEGRSASKSLNQAMKHLRESDKYSDVKYWAPFVLIGDDVTLDLGAKN